MNKAELISAIAEKASIAKVDAESAFSAMFEVITQAMAKQDKIAIPGFGNFTTKIRAERKGRNPATGKEIVIPRAIVAHFKAASQLKETINDQK